MTWPRLVPTALSRVATTIHAAHGIYYDNIISGAFGVADIVVIGQLDGVRTLVARFPPASARGIHLADAFLRERWARFRA